MAARNRGRKRDTGRDPGGFIALPWSVLDSPAYLGLSYPGRALLLEVARQYHRDDNGRMILTDKYLRPRGWRSPEVILRAKRELLAAGLIFETVMGARPNKASWYAVTWRMLDRLPGYDAGAEQAFVRGAYRLKGPIAGSSLTTGAVVGEAPIATGDVVEKPPATTGAVAMRHVSGPPPTTGAVVPLDVAISGARLGGVEATPGEAADEADGARAAKRRGRV